MEGRKENELKKEKRIMEIIEQYPRYIKNYYDTMYDKSYTTRYTYVRYVISFIEFLKDELRIDISNINCFRYVKASTINSYIMTMKDQGNSIKASKLYGLKSFFNYLVNDDYISTNPCDKVAIPKDNKEHTIVSLTKKEINVIKNNIKTGCGNDLAKKRQRKWVNRDYAIVMVGLSLGLRVTSLTEINLSDIDFETMELRIVEKGNKTRTVMFSDNLKVIIEKWMCDREIMLKEKGIETDALFISTRMKRITSDAIADLIKKYTYNIDKHITPHKLRSTCATNVYNNTGDIYLTADILGHSNIANTRRYAEISEDRKKKAAKAMDSILF